MSEYDSILKEKKESVKIKEQPKKFPKFLISFILITIVLIVSYVIYFNSILSPKNIIINDTLTTLKEYSKLIKNLPVEELKKENNLIGTIEYKKEKLNFNLNKNNNNLNFNISEQDKYLNYYLVNDKSYVKVPSINEYVYLNEKITIKKLSSFKEKMENLDEIKYSKNFYFSNQKPIVEINFKLNNNEIEKLLGLKLKDDYEVIATFKNTAIMNNISEIKIVINNNTTNKRSVIIINSSEFVYKNNTNTYKVTLDYHNPDFIFKINKNDILYSILSGTAVEENYKYTYQIIDTIYNINIIATKNIQGYNYEIIKKKDELEERMNITIKVEDSYLINNDSTSFINSDNGIIKDNYQNDINYFKNKFKSFFIN